MGFKTVLDRKVKLEPFDINFDHYDDIYLVFPVWAGRPSVYMKEWLVSNPFQKKNVYIHASSDSANDEYLSSIVEYIDETNTILESVSYKKAVKKGN